jgi:hypothetical protein
MSVVKLDKVELSNITVEDPIKDDSIYLSKINYMSKDLIIQSPKITVHSKNADSIEVNLTDEFYDFLNNYDKFMIDITAKNSSSWFSKELDTKKVSQIYKGSTLRSFESTEKRATFKLSDNLQIYSKDKELSLNDIKTNMEVILLIHGAYLVFYKANCIPYWDTLHIKVKEKKEVVNYDFRECDNEEKSKPKVKINLDDFEFN